MNIKLLLTYDGSRYRGWQRLASSDMTIQGKLENVLSRMTGEAIEVIGSGRTDAGAHAVGQVANFHCQTNVTAEEVKKYLRHYLPDDIGVISATEVDARFHSRYNAKEKTYRYRIWNSEQPCIFDRKYVWNIDDPLDLGAMKEVAKEFLGCHDFLAFCSNKHFKKSSIRTIHELAIDRIGPEIQISVTGDGFLYNMVRIMVGTLVAAGKGEIICGDISKIFESKVRQNAGVTAPANGLCLMEVKY